MEILDIIIKFLQGIIPILIKLGINIKDIVDGILAEKTLDEIKAELLAKRDDLEERPFQ